MKIRNGFVSNSSSSSFLVLFPKEPKNADDVKNMLFNEGQSIFSSTYGDDYWPVNLVAETIWKDIQEQEKNDFKSAKEEISCGSIDDPNAPDYDDFRHSDWRIQSDLYDAAREKFAEKKMKEFFNLRKLKLKKLNNEEINDNVLYIFEFSDNDGSYFSALEHGNLFHKLKHIRISKH